MFVETDRQIGITPPRICTHIVAEYQNDDGHTPSRAVSQTPVTPSPHPNLYADVLAAKQDGKCLVHPRWLTACLSAMRRLPESDFLPGTQSQLPTNHPRTEERSPSAEPACKIPRTASSNLLGDVNRRLELVLGGTNKGIDYNQDTDALADAPVAPSKADVPNDGSRAKHTPPRDGLELDGEHAVTVSFLGETNGSGPRRLRRNARRIVYGPALPNGTGTPIANANRGAHPEDLQSGDAVVDRAQPGQSLMVRWQYEDAPPRSPIDGSNASSDLMTNHRSVRSPTPTNPGQGIVGIDHLASRDGSRRDLPPVLESNSTELSSTTTTTTSMQPPAANTNPRGTSVGTTVNGKSGELNEERPTKQPVISFSGLAADERDQYAAIVTELGGEVDNQLTLSEKTTHLIVHTPSEFSIPFFRFE
ncbi:unnamed protein product [Echinostoma caproni]|uniref:BRCT domain-containing protein n=1 Tax=Echinostoma caproni TaxID=27848 RepID=A0A183AXV8_9TREM|nr:unnamed protein product [Echinostoma caproni]